jgi:Putative transposase
MPEHLPRRFPNRAAGTVWYAALTNARAFAAYLAPLRNRDWVVNSQPPFGGSAQVLRYLARYTHRVDISNRRLVAFNDKGVTFKWKNYRLEGLERPHKAAAEDDNYVATSHGFTRTWSISLGSSSPLPIPCATDA